MENAFIIIILQELNGLPVVYCFVGDILIYGTCNADHDSDLEGLNVAKCNLGKVNLKSMHPAVFPRNMHAGWLKGFALPCADKSALFAICSCFAIIAVFFCFDSKFTALPTLFGSQNKVSTLLLVGGCWQGWFPLTGSPWKPPFCATYLRWAPINLS